MRKRHGAIKAVIVTMEDGTEIEYDSQSECARELCISQSDVSKACRGQIPHYKGYKFRFKDIAIAKPGVV